MDRKLTLATRITSALEESKKCDAMIAESQRLLGIFKVNPSEENLQAVRDSNARLAADTLRVKEIIRERYGR